MRCGTSQVFSNCWRSTVRKLSAVFLATFALARLVHGQWQIVSSSEESATGVEHRHLEVDNPADKGKAVLDLALFSAKSSTLRVMDNVSGAARLSEAMARENCVAGVNGGYFDTDFKPIGLRVINGVTTTPLKRARLLTGVLCASSRGIEIIRLGEFSRTRKLDAALECGPFLVDRGTRVANLDDKHSARRTFAAVGRGGQAAVGVSSELTLAELAEALANRSIANDFKIWRAMNLDGGSSSAFWCKKNDGDAFSISEEKKVRDFVGVVPK
jgi:Phosphodiester glycosidase